MAMIIDHFKQKLNELSYSEKVVLYYLDKEFENIDESIFLNGLAKACNVSTTTVIRMCHKLDLDGFSNLKYQILDLQKNSKLKIVDDVISRNLLVVNSLLTSLDLKIVDNFSREILSKKRVFIISLGMSRTAANYMLGLLVQSKIMAVTVDDIAGMKVLSSNLSQDDLMIFVSASGETPALIELANICIFNKIDFLTITNVSDSFLYQNAKFAISINDDFKRELEYDITYRSYMMLTIDIIYENTYQLTVKSRVDDRTPLRCSSLLAEPNVPY